MRKRVRISATSGSPDGPRLPSRSLLVEEIDRQVASFEAESVQPGWSTWAILGSLAVGAWLALDELAGGQFTGAGVGLVMTLVILVVQLVVLAYKTASTGLEFPAAGPRFEWLPALRRVHLDAVVQMLIWAILSVLSWQPELHLPAYAKVPLSAYALLWVFGGVAIAAIPRFQVPVSKSLVGRGSRWNGAALFHGLAFVPATVGLVTTLWASQDRWTLADWRLGGLLAVGLLLLEHLAATTRTDHRIEALEFVRLQLVLGKVNRRTAAEALEALCSGLQTSQAFEPWTKQVLVRCKEVGSILTARCEEIDKVLGAPGARKAQLNEAELVLARAVQAAAASSIEMVRKELAAMHEARRKLAAMASVAGFFDSAAKASIAEVLTSVDKERDQLLALCTAYDDRIKLLEERLASGRNQADRRRDEEE